MKTVSITVKGRVQGVFYRQSTKEKAVELGITGKVSNLDNGDVQIIASGSEEKIDQFIEWCRQGPSQSNCNRFGNKRIATATIQPFPDRSLLI
jgi:acylphosphatase